MGVIWVVPLGNHLGNFVQEGLEEYKAAKQQKEMTIET